jgi:tRNA A37 threonylcarbamoyladenosine synthetase subunit TsaC/SUA5/YrdC
VVEAFKGKVALIIDAGSLPRTEPSTLYDTRSRKVLRKGPISQSEIERVLEEETG